MHDVVPLISEGRDHSILLGGTIHLVARSSFCSASVQTGGRIDTGFYIRKKKQYPFARITRDINEIYERFLSL